METRELPGRPTTLRRWKIAREGVPFVLAALVPAAVLFALGGGWAWGGAAFLLVAAAVAAFFRDPDREIPADPALVLSPADGRVTEVAPAQGGGHVVSIFLSVLDVHVNRSPVRATVARAEYRPGRFLPAYRPEAADRNEQNVLWLDSARGQLRVAQVAGILARRIVCRTRAGDRLAAGERFGLIRFGSCTRLWIPTGAEPLVSPGDRVRGGVTPLARWTAP
ncbi:MAG: phosphatidylserine decarboxylase family protein [Acidobacteria bacterium]|nr:phosphatidylserine decarboxylase family protein [Acidobacteriota bacterium]